MCNIASHRIANKDILSKLVSTLRVGVSMGCVILVSAGKEYQSAF